MGLWSDLFGFELTGQTHCQGQQAQFNSDQQAHMHAYQQRMREAMQHAEGYKYKPQKPAPNPEVKVSGRVFDGECTVVEIGGKKLLAKE